MVTAYLWKLGMNDDHGDLMNSSQELKRTQGMGGHSTFIIRYMGFQVFVANLFDIILGGGYLAGFFGISTKRGEYVCSEDVGCCCTVGVCSRLFDDAAC
jgi:hypothetical protein